MKIRCLLVTIALSLLLMTGCASRDITWEHSITTYTEEGIPEKTDTYKVTYKNAGNDTNFGNMELSTPSGVIFKLDNYTSQDMALRTTTEVLKQLLTAGAAGGVITGGIPIPVTPIP